MENFPKYYDKAVEVFFKIIDGSGGEYSLSDNNHENNLIRDWLPSYSLLMMREDKELLGINKIAESSKGGALFMQEVMNYLSDALNENDKKIFLKMQGDAFTATLEDDDPFSFVKDFVDYVGWDRSEVKGYANKVLESKDDKYKSVKSIFNLYQKMLMLFIPRKVAEFVQEGLMYGGGLPSGAKFWNYEQMGAINVLCTGFIYNSNKNKE
jgi:hypothetical protein